ncbi:MAG: hypothetical protein IT245_02825 [Bacteroidia bacterium]|nr:hypothetical protein [Bacteroidia bacterium]
MVRNLLSILYLCLLLSVSCKSKEDTYPNNVPKSYTDVSTVKVENYINRVYIDLLGREPLDAEASRDLNLLRDGDLSYESRKNMIRRLMTDSSFVVGDSSYKQAYYQRLYDLAKARLLEGAADADFYQQIGISEFGLKVSRLNGDSIGVYSAMATIDRCKNVIKSRREYQFGLISLGEMYARMLYNPIYDVINMNSLNFVNASFDDLFFRFPTRDEFDIAYNIIEKGKGGALFGMYASTKPDYCQMLVSSREFYEGMVKWAYLTLVGREPTTQESYNLVQVYFLNQDFQEVQTNILATDEYAHF